MTYYTSDDSSGSLEDFPKAASMNCTWNENTLEWQSQWRKYIGKFYTVLLKECDDDCKYI